LRISPHPYPRIHILWEFWAGNGDGPGFGVNLHHIGADGADDEVFSFQFLFYAEKGGGILLLQVGFAVGESEAEGEELDFGFLEVFGKSSTRALGIDPAFGPQSIF